MISLKRQCTVPSQPFVQCGIVLYPCLQAYMAALGQPPVLNMIKGRPCRNITPLAGPDLQFWPVPAPALCAFSGCREEPPPAFSAAPLLSSPCWPVFQSSSPHFSRPGPPVKPAGCKASSPVAKPAHRVFHARCCRSSVVEHSLGKGEVEGPIPSGSTIFHKVGAGPVLALTTKSTGHTSCGRGASGSRSMLIMSSTTR
jgi:hypothetical protein